MSRIDISVYPTKKQMDIICRFADYYRGNVCIDISDGEGISLKPLNIQKNIFYELLLIFGLFSSKEKCLLKAQTMVSDSPVTIGGRQMYVKTNYTEPCVCGYPLEEVTEERIWRFVNWKCPSCGKVLAQTMVSDSPVTERMY